MNHDLKIPQRSLMFIGPQRAGKSFALLATISQGSAYGKTLVVCRTADFKWRKLELEELGVLDAIVHLPLACPDVGRYLRNHGHRIADFANVALLTSSVFVDVGTIRLWERPSDSVAAFFEALCEPTAMLPRVYIEAHVEGHEHAVAYG